MCGVGCVLIVGWMCVGGWRASGWAEVRVRGKRMAATRPVESVGVEHGADLQVQCVGLGEILGEGGQV